MGYNMDDRGIEVRFLSGAVLPNGGGGSYRGTQTGWTLRKPTLVKEATNGS
jgi:hypothetical protein